jgi:hypothetical protein
METRPQMCLRSLQAPFLFRNKRPEMCGILRDAVAQRSFELRPYQFIGIEFWCIRWKEVTINARVLFQKLFNHTRPVGAASIPEQEDRSVYVSQQMAKKPRNLFSPYVFVGVELEIQRNAFLFWGKTESGNG